MWQCANAMDRAPGAASAQAASGAVRGGAVAKGLPPQSAHRLGCRRQARRLVGRGASHSIADTQVSRRHSIMEDTSHRAVCQTKDFTILRQSHRRDAFLRRCEGGLECPLFMLCEFLLGNRW